MAAQARIQGVSCALSQYARSACPFLVFPKRVLSGALGRDILNEARAIFRRTSSFIKHGGEERAGDGTDFRQYGGEV